MERTGNVESALIRHQVIYGSLTEKPPTWEDMIAAMPKDFNPWQPCGYSPFEDNVPGRQGGASDDAKLVAFAVIAPAVVGRVVRTIGCVVIRELPPPKKEDPPRDPKVSNWLVSSTMPPEDCRG
jgi:hypothetical protein